MKWHYIKSKDFWIILSFQTSHGKNLSLYLLYLLPSPAEEPCELSHPRHPSSGVYTEGFLSPGQKLLPKELKTFKFGGFSSHTNLDCFSTALCSAWCFGARNVTSQACFLGNLFLVTSRWWVLLFCLFGWGFGFIF